MVKQCPTEQSPDEPQRCRGHRSTGRLAGFCIGSLLTVLLCLWNEPNLSRLIFLFSGAAAGSALALAGGMSLWRVLRPTTRRTQNPFPQSAERPSLESAEHFRQLVEHLPYAIWMAQPDRTRLLYVNAEYERLFQQCRSKLYEAPQLWLTKVYAADRPRLMQAQQELETLGSSCEAFRIVHSDGTLRWLRERTVPIHNERDELYLQVGIAEDITLQHQGEQLFQEHLLFTALETAIHKAMTHNDTLAPMVQHCAEAVAQYLEAAFVHIWLLHDNGQMLELQASVGLDPHNAPCRIPVGHQTIIGTIAQERQPYMTNTIATDPQVHELAWARCDGMVAFVGSPLLLGNRLLGVLTLFAGHPFSPVTIQALGTIASIMTYGIERLQTHDALRQSEARFRQLAAQLCTDVSARKQTEAALQQLNESLEQRITERTAALQQANTALAKATRLKDEFLASMSHELRTPLNAILGMSEALEEEVYGSQNAQQLKALRSITESGQHLLMLINDILDLSKIAAGKLALHLSPTQVESCCKAALRLVEESARKKHLSLSLQLDPAVQRCHADPHRLKQILINLLSNAVKFTPQGGTIGLEVEGDSATREVRFVVWDTGIGIAREDIPRLFKPFVQLDSSLARRYEGTGLGLVLVQRLARLHGGRVSLESTVGQGSRFVMTLPWTDIENASVPLDGAEVTLESLPVSALPSPQPGAPSAPLILLAEDNDINAQTIVDYLDAKGYQLVVARNGIEAVAQVRALRPALILMDIQMPEMDGLEATRRLRNMPDAGLAATPILALTALAMPGDQERCLAAGANAYLSKPVSLKGLVQAIEAHVQSPPAAVSPRSQQKR